MTDRLEPVLSNQAGFFLVAAEQCDECLFTPGRIVSSQRMAGVLRECRQEDAHFVCHKYTVAEMYGAEEFRNVCCRGFWDRNPETTNLMRIASRLGVVRFVALPDDNLIELPDDTRRVLGSAQHETEARDGENAT